LKTLASKPDCKISGKQLVTFNAAHLTKAPSLRNTFANSRLNNSIVNDREKLNSVDASYIFDPKTESRLTAYYALLKNATQISFFYAEGILMMAQVI
jgi:hypothetical protein